MPALQATRLDVQAALAEGGTRSVAGGARGWPRRLLVVAEVALGVVLLVAAGLLIRTFVHLQTLSPGFDATNVVAASASLEDARYETHERDCAALRREPGAHARHARRGVGGGLARACRTSASSTWAAASSAPTASPATSQLSSLHLRHARLLRDAAPARPARPRDRRSRHGGQRPGHRRQRGVRARYLRDREPIGAYVRMANATPRRSSAWSRNVQQRGGFNGFGPIDALPIIYVPFAQFPTGGLRVYHGWFSPAWIVRAARPAR